ncbi:outer membrane protein [Flavobacteriaceae bacterium MAR_2010_188]|nr:outer membrane protein [Flavobacteriaceae bacterium MAR_2010_188]
MKYYVLVFIAFISFQDAISQTDGSITYNLQECIDFALQNNLDLKSAELRTKTADVNLRQSRNALLPNINGTYDIGKANGRSIDPFTNSYIDEQLTFSSARVQMNATISNGFRLINRWKQQNLNLKASEMAKEEARQNLILDVTLAYLQVMNNRDLLALSENRLENTSRQMGRLETLFNEEVGNPSEYRDFQGLYANDESSLITARNNYSDAKLNLKQLMNIDQDFEVENILIPVEFDEYKTSAEEIYQLALQNLATVKSSEYSLEAANKGVAVARSLYVPEFSIFANLNTNYSSSARFFTEGSSIIETTDGFVTIDGNNVPVLTNRTQFIQKEISYKDQFDNNLNSVAGLSVSIPLFNGFRAKNNVQLEKIKKEEAKVDLDRTKLDLRTSINQAYNDLLTAYERFNVLQKQVEAYEESLRINEIRFNNGASNSIDYIISKNNLDNSMINLNNVKYEIVLREKVLEYYKGNI